MGLIYSQGDHGPRVVRLQRLLIAAGAHIDDDGAFGPATASAVRDYQRANDMVIDGLVGSKTMARLLGKPLPRPLSQRDIQAAAERLGVDASTIMAFNEVESDGEGFIRGTDRPKILFERHIMYRRLKDAGYDADTLAQTHPNIVNIKPGGYAGGLAEHDRLAKACSLNTRIAHESASWGAFQIMGFHWRRLGYDSIKALVTKASSSEAGQLELAVRFIEADTRLLAAIRRGDWPRVAAIYNGPAYAKNDYDHKLAAAHRRYSGIPEAA